MIFMGFYMNKLIKKRITNSTKKGFTLVELVIIIAVIAILAGVSVAAYFGIQKEAKEKALLAEATDAYNEYKINQILNNDDSFIESSLIEGVYYSNNYDEYILFKDNTTYNLGSYIKESNEFSNSNRFAIDYDNDGLPVIIDLDNSVEGIESSDSLINNFVFNGYNDCVENIRVARENAIKVYELFGEDKYGDSLNYSPLFYFEKNDKDFDLTNFDDRETFSLGTKMTISYENRAYGISYSDEYLDFLKKTNVNLDNFELNFGILPNENLTLPSKCKNTTISSIRSFITDDLNYYFNIRELTIPSSYTNFIYQDSLFYSNMGGEYEIAATNLAKIIFENENFVFDIGNEQKLIIPLGGLYYGIVPTIILNSGLSNSFISLVENCDISNVQLEGQNYILEKTDDFGQTQSAKLSFINYIESDSLNNLLNNEKISEINILSPIIKDYEDLDGLIYEIKIETVPEDKLLLLSASKNLYKKTYFGDNFDSITLDPNASLDYKLANDLTIEGTLYLGSCLNQTGMGYQGLISGDYATLDLNGHTLTIKDGGYLESYGNIIDSVGGGKIVVEKGGKILTPFVVTDFNGGTVTVGRYNSNMSPFNSYMMPYLNANVEILNGGTLLGNCVLYAGGSHNETQIKFIGNTSDSLIQTLNDSSKVSLSKSGSLEDLSSYYEVIDLEGEFNINAMNLEFMTYNIKTNKVPFPISQYLSINIKNNSIIHLNQLLKVMYGSKINVDQSSTLIFEDIESSNSLQSGIFIYPSFNNNSIKYSNSNDVSKANGNILGLSYYEEEHYSSSIDIKGSITFKGNNHIFAGKFDIITNFRDIVNNLDKIEISSYSLYEGGDYQNSSKDWVKGEYNYQNGSSAANYYSLPLIINEKAYIKGSDNSLIEGSFDLNKGTFKDKDSTNTYIFIFDNNDFKFGYELFKDNVEMYFTYNSKGSFKKVNEVLNNDIYKINNKEYVYYLGTFVEGSRANENNTFTFINNKFKYNPLKKDLTEKITLTYSSTHKRWNQ